MTSTDFKHTPHSAKGTSTQSFGAHRQSDRPASAIRAGATTLPSAWQTRGVADLQMQHRHGAPARSIGDIAADPFRWVLATTPRAISVGFLSAIIVLMILF